MGTAKTTSWTLIDGAAVGDSAARDAFVRLYEPVVRAYLAARWRESSSRQEIDDAVQETFVDCFRRGGALERAERDRAGGFQAFLYGVVRNVALRAEDVRAFRRRKIAASVGEPSETGSNRVDPASLDASLSRVFDRAWATALLREAADLHRDRAREAGHDAWRRFELLRLRFEDDLPIREIARRWGVDAAGVHHDYAAARDEFRAALTEVVATHHPGTKGEIDRRCESLLASVSVE